MADRPASEGGGFTSPAGLPAEPAPARARTSITARIYTAVSVLLAAAVVFQLYVAGAGVFTMADHLDSNKAYSPSAFNSSAYWGLHFLNALFILLVIMILVAMSFVARKPARTKWLTGLLVLLFAIQATLGLFPIVASVAALHVINAFVILGVVLLLVWTNWAFGRPGPWVASR